MVQIAGKYNFVSQEKFDEYLKDVGKNSIWLLSQSSFTQNPLVQNFFWVQNLLVQNCFKAQNRLDQNPYNFKIPSLKIPGIKIPWIKVPWIKMPWIKIPWIKIPWIKITSGQKSLRLKNLIF